MTSEASDSSKRKPETEAGAPGDGGKKPKLHEEAEAANAQAGNDESLEQKTLPNTSASTEDVPPQKITPFFWFDAEAAEAMTLYTSLFPSSKIENISRYSESHAQGPAADMGGRVLNGSFLLAGQRFLALDGGPMYKFTPTLSLFVHCDSEKEVDEVWSKLSNGGMVMMELGEYPWSKKYGWTADKFGLSWQVSLGSRPQKICPHFMFVGPNHGKCEEAVKLYTSLFPNSGVKSIARWEAGNSQEVAGTVKHMVFQLNGKEYSAMESKHEHPHNFTEAFSFLVDCKNQEEVDVLSNKLSSDPKFEQCGWLKDHYGVSWQIIPSTLTRYMGDSDPVRTSRVMEVFFKMKRIDIAVLTAAYEGKSE